MNSEILEYKISFQTKRCHEKSIKIEKQYSRFQSIAYTKINLKSFYEIKIHQTQINMNF